ncbi:LacI family DNA-binding transcriptional regulator [Uliginosibacterium paludis]|uniref:LacI family DNA-binding transcriptional regulator n=1 Tax=Uliginosibacterium paludis TaxID=1615952 RepID=A0ABV2CS86_9RHOO
MNRPRIRIHDVAAAAGVSLATVDRVLNKRPGVRQVTVDKVEAALRALDYRPDIHAARLARGQALRLMFIVPRGHNSFMDMVVAEIRSTADRLRHERCDIELRFVDAFDGPAVASMLDALSPDDCDGVAVVAPDAPGVREAIDACVARGLHLVTLVSDLPSSHRQHFVGIDNIAAGRVAGRLLGRLSAGRSGRIALIAGSMTLRDHMERHLGCEQVLRADFPHLRTLPVVEGRDFAETTAQVARELLAAHPDIVGLYNMGAGNRGLVEVLRQAGAPGRIVTVAHELTPHVRQALVEGVYDAIVCQDAAHEVRSAVRVLQALCEGGEVVRSQERIRIEVYLKDNLP